VQCVRFVVVLGLALGCAQPVIGPEGHHAHRAGLTFSQWLPGPALPQPTTHAIVTLGPTGELFVISGQTPTGNTDAIWRSSLSAPAWRRTSLPVPVSLASGTWSPRGEFLVAGGLRMSFGTGVDVLARIDPATGAADAGASMPFGFGDALFLLTADQRLLYVGGATYAAEYDPVADQWRDAGTLPTFLCSAHAGTALLDSGVLIHCFLGSFDLSAAGWSRFPTGYPADINSAATLLPSGEVLSTGGLLGGPQARTLDLAWRFEPATRTTMALPVLPEARADHVSLLLPSNEVLLAGGYTQRDGGVPTALATTVLHDGVGGAVVGPPLSIARTGAGATLLPDGRVVVVGGDGMTGFLASSEVLTRFTDGWTTLDLPALPDATNTTLVPLASGQVLLVGPGVGGRAVAFDPNTSQTSPRATPQTQASRRAWAHLPTGEVLLCGGTLAGGSATERCERYEEGTDVFRPAAPFQQPRPGVRLVSATATEVLALGDGTTRVESYSPALDRWTTVSGLQLARTAPAVLPLDDGSVLVAGGAPTSVAERRINGVFVSLPLSTGPAPLLTGLSPDRVLVLDDTALRLWSLTSGTSEVLPSPAAPFEEAVRLWDGRVLYLAPSRADVATFDPFTRTWLPSGAPPRQASQAVVLTDERVLTLTLNPLGGMDGLLYRPTVAPLPTRQPALSSRPVLPRGASVVLAGERLIGLPACDGMVTTPACNVPLLQWRRLDGASQGFVRTSSWTPTRLTAHVPNDHPQGLHVVRPITAGVPGPSTLAVGPVPTGALCASPTMCQSSFCVAGVCCASACPGGSCVTGVCVASTATRTVASTVASTAASMRRSRMRGTFRMRESTPGRPPTGSGVGARAGTRSTLCCWWGSSFCVPVVAPPSSAPEAQAGEGQSVPTFVPTLKSPKAMRAPERIGPQPPRNAARPPRNTAGPRRTSSAMPAASNTRPNTTLNRALRFCAASSAASSFES
jgi:hypothetical protein